MSTLPPLIFKGEEPYDVWHPLKIAYEIREDQRTPAYPYSSRNSHPTGLFGCLRMDKCGINCYCARDLAPRGPFAARGPAHFQQCAGCALALR